MDSPRMAGPQTTASPAASAGYDHDAVESGASAANATPTERSEFTRIYMEVLPAMVSFGRRYITEHHAEDVAQETLAGIWSRWSRIPPESRTLRFFLAAMHRRVISERRSQIAEDAAMAEGSAWTLGGEHENPESAVESWELAHVIEQAVERMPEGRRLVWQLIRDDGMSYARAAQTLGVSQNTIHKHMSRALADLREVIEIAGYPATPDGKSAGEGKTQGSEGD